jgi:predicted permease
MAFEIALSTAVLLAGTLLAISFVNVMRADRGFVADHVVTEALSLASPRYAQPDVRTRFVGDTLEALRHLPGVAAAGETSQLPLQGESWIDSLIDPDRGDTERNAPLTNHRFVSPGFIGAMGIQLRAGRDFDESDRRRSVALISERAARLLWPRESAIGKHVRGPGGGGRQGEPPPIEEVIGVVADVRAAGLEKEPPPTVYTPYWRLPGGAGGPLFALRTRREAASIAGEIRAAVAGFDPELPVPSPQSMNDAVWGAASLRLFQTSIVSLFTATALVIAAIGLYGLVSFAVARRTREIGIRMALGATRGAVARTVFRQGLRPVAIGAAPGLALALVAGDVLTKELYGVTPRDPAAIAIVALTLAAVSVLACWIPMRRATRVDPVMALRAE